jgi:mono/diheme cytochrome c family protein
MFAKPYPALLLLLALAGAPGCGKKEEPAAAPPAAPAPAAVTAEPLTAESVFKTRCSTCHGEGGHGDGPASVALNPKPRNYTDPEWQKSVTDEQLKKTIVGGGVAVGKSPLMVPNPDLAGKDDVLDGLVKIIRSFAPKT